MNTKLLTTVTIPATKGTKVIADSKFFTYIDSDFKRWGADKKGGERPETTLEVREMEEDATFEQMMSKENLLTQEQILYFVEHHQDQLRTGGYATFFPFKSGDKFFVARVGLSSGGPHVDVDHLSGDGVWGAGGRHRVVVPQLTPSPSDLTLSDSDTLTLAIEAVKKAGFIIYKEI